MVRWIVLAAALLLAGPASAQVKQLNQCMDAHYGAGQWTQRTSQGVGTDIGPALNTCLQQIRGEGGRGKIIIPTGIWLMNTPPNPDLLSGTYIEGLGSQASVVIFNNTCMPYGAVAFWWNGANGFTGGGMRGVGLLLEAGLGETNCYGIMLRGSGAFQPDQVEFDDIYMSALGPSYWWSNLHIDGSARAMGVRVIMLRNMQLFNSRALTVYISRAVALVMTAIGCWTGIGPNANVMYIDPSSVEVSKCAVWCVGQWTE